MEYLNVIFARCNDELLYNYIYMYTIQILLGDFNLSPKTWGLPKLFIGTQWKSVAESRLKPGSIPPIPPIHAG